MSPRRMTPQQMDTYLTWWRIAFFCFALTLMLDVVYLGVSRPAGEAKVVCVLIAVTSIAACLYALRKLHQVRHMETNSGRFSGDSYDLPAIADLDVPDLLSFDNDD